MLPGSLLNRKPLWDWTVRSRYYLQWPLPIRDLSSRPAVRSRKLLASGSQIGPMLIHHMLRRVKMPEWELRSYFRACGPLQLPMAENLCRRELPDPEMHKWRGLSIPKGLQIRKVQREVILIGNLSRLSYCFGVKERFEIGWVTVVRTVQLVNRTDG